MVGEAEKGKEIMMKATFFPLFRLRFTERSGVFTCPFRLPFFYKPHKYYSLVGIPNKLPRIPRFFPGSVPFLTTFTNLVT